MGDQEQCYYAALLPRRGPHYASHSVCLSVRPSRYCFCLFYERTSKIEKLLFSLMGQRHVCTFRHAQRAAYRTAISAAQILVGLVTEVGGSYCWILRTEVVGTRRIKLASMKMETCHIGRIPERESKHNHWQFCQTEYQRNSERNNLQR